MKIKLLLLITSIFLIRCAAYKELSPDPEVSFLEQGYIELKDDDDLFELDQGKKYFMVFPQPVDNNFFLVLDIADKQFLNSYLTNIFDDGEGRIIEIPDESPDPNRMSVYPVDRSVQKFYWVIDLVKRDVLLDVDYRYVPKWRFKFESRYAELQELVTRNTVNRSPYHNIGSAFDTKGFDYGTEINSVKMKAAELTKVHDELKEIEAILPQDILNSQDEAYLDYVNLKKELAEEEQFQQDYVDILTIMKLESETRGNMAAFVENVPEMLAAMENKDRFADNVKAELKKNFQNRLPAVTPFFEKEIVKKRDATKIAANIEAVQGLYEATGNNTTEGFDELADFVGRYNGKVEELENMEKELNELQSALKNQMPSNTFFSAELTKITKLQYKLPKESSSEFGKYRDYSCVRALNTRIRSVNAKVNKMVAQYREADRLVPRINAMKAQKNYRGVRQLLNQNGHLVFLKDMYKGLDQMSLDDQSRRIKDAWRNGNFAQSETLLKNLHYDTDFLYPNQIRSKKSALVKTLEDSLYSRIDRMSRQRADRFVNENLTNVNDVESLYSNPAFQPLHQMTFSAAGPEVAKQKMKKLNDRLIYLRDQEFPTKAIKQLYTDFTANPNADGVFKGRAIVIHGRHYSGDDRSIKNRVAECDPWASKWITKAKDYRRLFVLPSSTNRTGSNEYVFRVNVRIPSEAKFPVYDLNFKLPAQVAKEASSAQWYDTITLNKKPVKNEGRFSITAPTAANNYECQIGPVRMVKDADNVLEVRFKNNSFKVFEISVMAQTPIIKKNQ